MKLVFSLIGASMLAATAQGFDIVACFLGLPRNVAFLQGTPPELVFIGTTLALLPHTFATLHFN